MAIDIAENLFDAISTIAEKKLEGLKYDKTIVCSITDNSTAEEGKYTVKSSNAEFIAYSENTTYRVGTSVYVTIPQGDYNNKKLIIGKYISSDTLPYVYVSPLENFVNINKISVGGSQNSFSIKANGEITEKQIQEINDIINAGYDRMVLTGKVQTSFNKEITQGSYGIRLKIQGKNKAAQKITKYSELDNKDMFGNVYNLIINEEQQKAFDISEFSSIDNIKASIYQNNNFKTKDDNGVEIPFENNSNPIDDIIFNDISINLGYSLDKYNEDTAILHTLNSEFFSTTGDTEKIVDLSFVHFENETVEVINKDSDAENKNAYQITWYQWIFANDIADDKAGMFWRNLDNVDPIEGINIVTVLEGSDYSKRILIPSGNPDARLKVIIEKKNAQIEKDENGEDKEVITYEKICESKELVFTNTDDVEYKLAVDLIKGLSLSVKDTYNGMYNIYNTDGTLINSKDGYTKHPIVATYNSLVTGYDYFDGAEDISWYIPKNNTMVQVPESGVDYGIQVYKWQKKLTAEEFNVNKTIYYTKNEGVNAGYTQVKNEVFNEGTRYYILESDNATLEVTGDYYIITRKASDGFDESLVGEDDNLTNTVQNIKIKTQYVKTFTNNTIKCVMVKGGLEYTAEVTLYFDVAGTNGTNYSIISELVKEDANKNIKQIQAIKLGDSAILRFQLRDFDGSVINKELSVECKMLNNNSGVTVSKRDGESDYYEYILTAPSSVPTVANIAEITIIFDSDKQGELSHYALKQQVPIAITADESYIYSGPDRVVYNAAGVDPQYYKGAIQLFNAPNFEISVWDGDEPADTNFLPSIGQEDNCLKPKSMYVNASTSNYYLKLTNGKDFLWQQPIYIYQNQYGNSAINQWDGSLKIDEENNQILSSIIGAGSKSSNNTFTGILMGTVGKDIASSKTGLSAYSEGLETFNLDTEGTVTIGGKGVIKSQDFKQNDKQGMEIDLKSGKITSYEFELESKKIKLKSISGSDDDIVEISKDDKTKLMVVGGQDYYLQSANYNSTNNPAGFKLDLNKNKIIGYDSNLTFTRTDFTECKNNDFSTVDGVTQFKDNVNYYTRTEEYTLSVDTERDNNKKYYIKNEDETYTLYTDKLTDDQGNPKGEFYEVDYSYNLVEGDYEAGITYYTKSGSSDKVTIKSDDENYPIKVGSKFKIGWNGSLIATAGSIGGWTIQQTSLEKRFKESGRGVRLSPTEGLILGGQGTFKDTPIKYTSASLPEDAVINTSGSNYQVNEYVPIAGQIDAYNKIESVNSDGTPNFESEVTYNNTGKSAVIDTYGNANFTNLTVIKTIKGTCQNSNNSKQLEGHSASYFAKANHSHQLSIPGNQVVSTSTIGNISSRQALVRMSDQGSGKIGVLGGSLSATGNFNLTLTGNNSNISSRASLNFVTSGSTTTYYSGSYSLTGRLTDTTSANVPSSLMSKLKTAVDSGGTINITFRVTTTLSGTINSPTLSLLDSNTAITNIN